MADLPTNQKQDLKFGLTFLKKTAKPSSYLATNLEQDLSFSTYLLLYSLGYNSNHLV